LGFVTLKYENNKDKYKTKKIYPVKDGDAYNGTLCNLIEIYQGLQNLYCPHILVSTHPRRPESSLTLW
jgi:hypothetical protein